MILQTLVYVFLIAVVLIAAATVAIVLLRQRMGKDRTWMWRTFGLSVFAIVTLAVGAGAIVLLNALWGSDSQAVLAYTTPTPHISATATAAPTERVAVAPTEIAEPQPSSSASVTVIDKMCDFQDTVRTLADCSIFSYPSTSAPKLAHLKKGTCVNRLGFNPNGWSKISSDGVVGYQQTKWLESVDRDENEVVAYNDTVYVTEAGDLYAKPDSDSDKLLYATKKMTMTRTGVTCDGWSQISYEGNVYYMLTDKLLGS